MNPERQQPLTSLAAILPQHGFAQDVESWTQQKCILYTEAWNHLGHSSMLEGVSEQFVADHIAFLETGCLDRRRVCPRSEAELALADILSLMAVAEGMAGSFLPFHCDD
ncbi:MAG: hypothetical protein JJT99_13850 [Rhodobacteraceae bacterium]|nr:hypothetical protein [Paracoccaceae bacterium]